MLWFRQKYKVKIKLQKYCEHKRNTAKMKRMYNALTLFWLKTSDRKKDTRDRKLLLGALEIKAELKMLEGDLEQKCKQGLGARAISRGVD